MMSVLQATAWYPPHSVGGTEVYLSTLVRELLQCDVTSTIITPCERQESADYQFEGTTVKTYPVNTTATHAELRGSVPHKGFSRFSEILAEVRPDVYHQHSWSRGLGLSHLQAARALGLRTILTVHVPNVVCLRGTMMRYGRDACDGWVEPHRCAACWSHSRGAPRPLARVLAGTSSRLGSVVERILPTGRVRTAFSAYEIASQRRLELATIAASADRIVVVCQWLYDAFALNGVATSKLVLNRQGVDAEFAAAVDACAQRRDAGSKLFRLVYVGRWDNVKGIDVLVRAVRALSREVPLELVIHGVGDGPEEIAYKANLRRLAAGDPRIKFAAPVARSALPATLVQASAIAVPSRCLETGPLVVLEAKAAGLPVIGSKIGGIAELVREPDDGLLVPPNNVRAWRDAILRLMRCPSLSACRTGFNTRTMRDVAADMSAIYREVCEPMRVA